MSNRPKWFYNQSGVIPYRIKADKIRILLITTRQKKRWSIPKGVIEPNMTARESALQEAWEEAGIKGKINQKSIGSYSYKKWDGICDVKVYLMRVTKVLDAWPESGFRERQWVTQGKAYVLIENTEIKNLFKSVDFDKL